MFVVIPVRLVERMAPPFLLLGLMFTAGIAASQIRTLFFTIRPSPVFLDLIVILMTLAAGWLLLRLGTRLFKSPADHNGGGILSKIGFKAWVIFLMALAVFATGGCFGRAIDWSQFGPHLQNAQGHATHPATSGRIFIAPPVPPAPKPTTSSKT